MKRREALVGLTSLAAATTATVSGARAPGKESWDQVVAAATKEGELPMYPAHYAVEPAEEYGREFTARYPGVKCNVIRTTAHVAYQRLAQELKAGGPQVDVFASTDVSHCLELKSKGLLEAFTPANAKTVLPEVQNQDPDGTFHTTSLGVIGITYNSSPT